MIVCVSLTINTVLVYIKSIMYELLMDLVGIHTGVIYFKKNFKGGNLKMSKNGSGKNELNYVSNHGPAAHAFKNLERLLRA